MMKRSSTKCSKGWLKDSDPSDCLSRPQEAYALYLYCSAARHSSSALGAARADVALAGDRHVGREGLADLRQRLAIHLHLRHEHALDARSW